MGLVQKIYKMNQWQLFVPESKSALKNLHSDGKKLKKQEPTEKSPSGQSYNNMTNKINKVVLDYTNIYIYTIK